MNLEVRSHWMIHPPIITKILPADVDHIPLPLGKLETLIRVSNLGESRVRVLLSIYINRKRIENLIPILFKDDG
jgi:hypothetical protein